jgi:hypothetical protein
VVAVNECDGDLAGNGGRLALELFGRGECVAPARDEQAREPERGEMLGAEPVRLPRRVQRVADEDERGRFEAFGHSE